MPASNHALPAVVILGASVRALAVSATRAGWAVHAGDLFADTDLASAAVSCRVVAEYPAGLREVAASFPHAPWCYTGAVENHPDLIDRIAATRPLAGNAGAAVRRVRDPALLAASLADTGLRFPVTFSMPDGVPTDGSFVMKPRASAGGHGIVRWTPACAAGRGGRVDAAHVWQRWVDGLPMAAAYCLTGGRAVLMAASRQILGMAWSHAAAHAYCGSVAVPSDAMPDRVHDELGRLGHLLAESYGLVGVLGVDFILGADGHITVIEVNPRPTASMELVERSSGDSIAGMHLAACGFAPEAPPANPTSGASPGVWSKAILFAASDIVVDGRLLDRVHGLAAPWTGDDGWPAIADIPSPGQTLARGRPVMTIFARGETERQSETRLRTRLEAIDAIVSDDIGGQPAMRRGSDSSAAADGSTYCIK